ncbi:hypothetical protein [Saccharopolyspora taberi]|uniref:Uncharacterized protein n=1 Tax=Saccharopolyspora taberi TaxID=60895 RepID=A0ABN3VHV0_9PSEU
MRHGHRTAAGIGRRGLPHLLLAVAAVVFAAVLVVLAEHEDPPHLGETVLVPSRPAAPVPTSGTGEPAPRPSATVDRPVDRPVRPAPPAPPTELVARRTSSAVPRPATSARPTQDTSSGSDDGDDGGGDDD